MDNAVFRIEVCAKNSLYYDFYLPMTPYEMLDMLDILGMSPEETPIGEVTESESFPRLFTFVEEKANVYELNALAERLAQMDHTQRIAFEGLLEMESAKRKPFGIERLVDLAYSTDCCNVHPDIWNFKKLGRFYVENRLVPELEGISDRVLPFIDYEAVGLKLSKLEGGKLIRGGYVTQTAELLDVFHTLDLSVKKPDYMVLMELSKDERHTLLKLPADTQTMYAALDTVGAEYWSGVELRCLDCRVPNLIDSISFTVSITQANRFAELLEQMDSKQLVKFKAVLEAKEEYSVQGAANIANMLDTYLFTPQYSTPADMAADFIRTSMGTAAAETLLPFVNLSGYGNALLQEQGSVITNYGLISREDGQPVQEMQNQPSQGGMEMM